MLSQGLRAFYDRSPMREGVLCWYPFAAGAKVLDMSGGALSALLQSRCGRVVSSDDYIDGDKGFDYVVVIDPADYRLEALRGLRSALHDHGRLLLAYENPFALRYWSGKPSPLTGLAYDSLYGRDGRPSAAALRLSLAQAGFGGQKWYYPLTDHWFAREVYSEDYLPDEYLGQRFVPYLDDDGAAMFDERPLYREAIRGGAFPFLCGAYLVEARADGADAPCPVDYAAVTAYRAPAKRFATTVRNDGTVHKSPLHEDGRDTAKAILRNHEALARMGVPVTQLRAEGDALVMPRYETPTLWGYWARKLTEGSFDAEEMLRHYDQIVDAIHKAAADGDCYWELVPANCFYDEQSGGLLFFDQEYRWEGYPPEAAVARAVMAARYSPALSADPRSAEWMETLIQRYGLADRWDALEAQVKRATAEVFGGGAEALAEATRVSAEGIASTRRRARFQPVPGKLRELGYRRPAIYGYGRRGKDLAQVMGNAGMEPAAIIDEHLAQYPGIEALGEARGAEGPGTATEAGLDVDVVVVSVSDSEGIVAELKRMTSLPVYALEALLDESDG